MSSSSSFVYRDEVHARRPPTSRDPTESVFDYPAFDSAAPITSPRVPPTKTLTILPTQHIKNYPFQATVSSCRTFQIP